jgi:hypothetical protein
MSLTRTVIHHGATSEEFQRPFMNLSTAILLEIYLDFIPSFAYGLLALPWRAMALRLPLSA